MNKFLRYVSAFLILVLISILIYFLILSKPNFSSDTVAGLLGAIIGALISTASQSWISYFDRKNQLRLAAIDRRLSTHQEAYALWRKLISNINNEQSISNVVIECQEWWEKNCLFIDPKARKAFQRAYLAANNHHSFFLDRSNPELVKLNMLDIMDAGPAIVDGVALPVLGESEP